MNLKDFFKIEDVEFTDEELELPYETYGVDKPEQIWYNISIITTVLYKEPSLNRSVHM